MKLICIELLILGSSLAVALQDGDLRLAGGIQTTEGRVEVYYNGQWGTVCDDNWSIQSGNVVCKQLGYERAEKVSYSAAYGPGSGQIWIDEINCEGTENSITECKRNDWDENDCTHNEDAGVVCARRQVTRPANLPIRLSCPLYTTGGACKVCPSKRGPVPGDCSLQTAVEGIVQAYNGDKWIALSGIGWNLKAASVACGELGYPVATKVPSLQELWPNVDPQTCERRRCDPSEVAENNAYRKALQQTMVRGLECNGNERSIHDCYAADFSEIPSSTNEIIVATVRCSFIPHSSCSANSNNEMYRLRGGAMPWAGRVEVRIGGQWGTICDSQWDALEGNVVCRSLGYGTVKAPFYGAQYGRGVGKIHFTDLRCTGGETLLSSCPKKEGVAAESCGHQRDAGVECNVPSSQCWDRSSRLYEERDLQSTAVQSYVEVKGPLGWGILCYNNNFEYEVGHAVCRESKEMFSYRMRKGTSVAYSGNRYTGNVTCGTSAVSVKECELELSTSQFCPDEELVVDCTAGLPDLVPDLEAFENSLRNHPYVERQPIYYLRCALEEGCLSASAAGKPDDHQRALLRFDSRTMNWGKADFISNLQPSQWIWHSCHNHYHSYKGFSQYDILDFSGQKVADGAKVSFCLEDSMCASGTSPQYKCATGNQGITANCGDVYASFLDCQWIDVTDVPPGEYTVRLYDNPFKFVPESDHLNNMASCKIQLYPLHYISVLSCSLSGKRSHCFS